MRKPRKHSGQAGITVVELMMVVAIIGTLSTIAMGKFRTFKVKAQQAEAKTNLHHIYTLQTTYFHERGTFVAGIYLDGTTVTSPTSCQIGNPLGFAVQNCLSSRYHYFVAATGGANPTFSGFAMERIAGGTRTLHPGCPLGGLVILDAYDTSDLWSIDQTNNLVHITDSVAMCP